METIEIRYNKKRISLFMAFFAVVVIGTSIFIFSSKKLTENTMLVLFYTATAIILCYTLYRFYKKVNTDEPALTLTNRTIEVRTKNGPAVIPWSDVHSVTIETDEGSHTLVLETKSGKEKLPLNFLTKNAKEIETLINEYRANAQR